MRELEKKVAGNLCVRELKGCAYSSVRFRCGRRYLSLLLDAHA